jgi:PAS domain S-box-containing protein
MLGFYEYAQAGEKELLRYAIEGAGIVTGSPLGYLAFLNGDESELSMYAWSASAMAECAIRDKPIVYKTAKTGLWGEAVRQRRPVITNNYAAPDPAKKGYPEGHPHITRHMNVPVIEDGHIVLLAGVANKPADYTDHDTSELLLLMQGLWSILKRKQVQEEQKRAYDLLKRSEEELRLLKISVDQSADEVFWLDFAGNILYVNDAACRVNGYSPDEFRTMTIYDLNPDITPAIWAGSVADLRQRKTQLITTRHRHRDGVTIDVEIMAVYVNRDGNEYSFAFVRDITGRKQAESAVRESGRKYEELFELGSEAIFLIDNETGALLEANAAACDMYGYSRDMLLSMKNTDLSAEKEETRKVTGESPAGIVRVPLRYHRRRNGTVFPVEIIGRFFTWNGRPVHIAAIRDITERQQAEAAIRETNRKLNLLNSITRHDIRNQLMIAQGYAQLAALNKPDPAVAGLLAGISTAVGTIQHQIEFTREYQELGVRAPVWIRAGDIIRGAGTEKIRLTCTCDAVEIYADPMIDKVFFNLFDNAVKHGTRVTDIVVGCEERACGLVITFADNGIGIPDEEKEKIFEKGYGKNTGFGLFLVREILAITGITIRETGTSGTGAVFEIVVPEGSYRIGK